MAEFNGALESEWLALRHQAELLDQKLVEKPFGRLTLRETLHNKDATPSFKDPFVYDLLPASVEVEVVLTPPGIDLLRFLKTNALRQGAQLLTMDSPEIIDLSGTAPRE